MQIDSHIIIRTLIVLTGILTIITMLFVDGVYSKIYILVPIFYLLFTVLFPNLIYYSLKGLGIFALNVSMYIRYLILPLFDTLFRTENRFFYADHDFNTAIILMIYEMLIVFLVITFFSKRFYKEDFENKEIKSVTNYSGWIYLTFCTFLILVFPHLISTYSFILTTEQFETKISSNEGGSSLAWFISLGKLVLIMSIINFWYKKYDNHHRIIYVILTLVGIFLISSFIAGTSRFSVLLPLTSGLFVTFIIYRKYNKFIGVFSCLTLLFTTIITTVIKTNTVGTSNESISLFESFTNSLSLYFSGVSNIAIALQASEIYSSFNIQSILSDIFNSVVIINSFFNSSESALEAFNIIFYNGGLARDQILPIIGQGYLYFGYILSPILLILVLIMMMYFDKMTKSSDNILTKFIYSYITIKLGLIMMSNFTIVLSFITNNFIPLILIVIVNKILTKKEVQI